MTAIRRELEQLIGRRTVTPELLARAEQRVLEHGSSLEALTAFTDVLLSTYHRGRMPEQTRELFRAGVVRLHREAAREVNVTPAFVRLSGAQIEGLLERTTRLIEKHEAQLAELNTRFDRTVSQIDNLEQNAEQMIARKKQLLGLTEAAKGRSQTTSVVSGIAGLVPGVQLAKLAIFIPGLGPLALAAFGFGGYKAYQSWQKAEGFAAEIVAIDRQIQASELQLSTLKSARKTFDGNIQILKDGLSALKKIETEYRAAPAEDAVLTSADQLAALARKTRRTEALAHNLKQQIGVWTAMNEHAGDLHSQFDQLKTSLEVEVAQLDRTAKDAQAEFLTSVLTTVFDAANIKGFAATAIKQAVLLTQVGPEVTVIEQVQSVLAHLGLAEKKQQALTASAAEIIETIDHLSTDRADFLDPSFDRELATLSEPQRFLIDVALSDLNTKIDPAALIALARAVPVSDEQARELAKLLSKRSTTRAEAQAAVEDLGRLAPRNVSR